MKDLVLKRYQNIEGYDPDMTLENVEFIHQEIRKDFIRRIHTKIEGTWAEIKIDNEKKNWYNLGGYEFLATRTEYSNGRVAKTVEISGVA